MTATTIAVATMAPPFSASLSLYRARTCAITVRSCCCTEDESVSRLIMDASAFRWPATRRQPVRYRRLRRQNEERAYQNIPPERLPSLAFGHTQRAGPAARPIADRLNRARQFLHLHGREVRLRH